MVTTAGIITVLTLIDKALGIIERVKASQDGIDVKDAIGLFDEIKPIVDQLLQLHPENEQVQRMKGIIAALDELFEAYQGLTTGQDDKDIITRIMTFISGLNSATGKLAFNEAQRLSEIRQHIALTNLSGGLRRRDGSFVPFNPTEAGS